MRSDGKAFFIAISMIVSPILGFLRRYRTDLKNLYTIAPWRSQIRASESMAYADYTLICIPYDSGYRNLRMGAGPSHLIAAGAASRLEPFGTVSLTTLEAHLPFKTEIGTAFELHREGAAAVSACLMNAGRPIVLAGNCNSSLGTVAGIQCAEPDVPLGVILFDGHGDCNTPETFEGDFLDAMGISTLTGRCWQALASTVQGFRPIPDENVILVGGHGADEGAERVLSKSAIRRVPPQSDIFGDLSRALDQFEKHGVQRIYLHLDLDVLDPTFGRANNFVPDGGLSPSTLKKCVWMIANRCTVTALAIASYDPAEDTTGSVANTALEVLSIVSLSQNS